METDADGSSSCQKEMEFAESCRDVPNGDLLLLLRNPDFLEDWKVTILRAEAERRSLIGQGPPP